MGKLTSTKTGPLQSNQHSKHCFGFCAVYRNNCLAGKAQEDHPEMWICQTRARRPYNALNLFSYDHWCYKL